MKKTLFFLFSTLMNVLSVNAQTAYAVFTSEDNTLTFYYDENYDGSEGQYDVNSCGWLADETNTKVERVVFDASFKDARPTSTANWFNNMRKLRPEAIVNLDYLNTSEVTTMEGMFAESSALTSLDLSSFNTSKVTNMQNMFQECILLTSVNLSSFNTENVTSMNCMFHNCTHLSDVDLSSFNTENVTSMQQMFTSCPLKSLDLSNFNTSKVTNMQFMFYWCTKLTSINLSSFNTENVTEMNYMFGGCKSLTSIDLSNFNTGKVYTMQNMFESCISLTSLDLSSFNTETVRYMSKMFLDSKNLETIYVAGGWNMASLSTSYNMFQGCTALVGGKGTAYDANHVDYEYARIDGGEEQPGYFTYKPSRDLNDDGKVSTADIQVIINEMKGAQQSGTVSPEKDLNNDGKISTADIQVIINEMKK